MLKIAMIAGEASGDKLGAAMIDGFDALLDQPADFIGVGGPLMIERGMDSLFDMSELSVMGIVEILKQYGHLKRRLNQCADYILAQKPDVLITIDAPEFSLRLAEIIKSKSNPPTLNRDDFFRDKLEMLIPGFLIKKLFNLILSLGFL